MALVVNDRVKETSTTTGTGTFDLAGAATGFQTFVAGIGDTNTTYYAIFNQGTTEWEVGLGTVTDAATDTLARTTVLESSNSDAAVDFAAGTKDVFCTLPASRAVFGKQEGTNFTGSLLVGHSTTGTLNSASNSTGIGLLALDAITSGSNNLAVGYSAGSALTASNGNTFIGSYSGRLVSAGGSGNNTFVGFGTGYDATTASTDNTFIGKEAGYESTSGSYNAYLGKDAGKNVTTGNYNICVGYDAGDNLVDGSGNIVIGTADTAATDSARTCKIVSYDGSSTTNHFISDSSGNVTFAGTATANGSLLATQGDATALAVALG